MPKNDKNKYLEDEQEITGIPDFDEQEESITDIALEDEGKTKRFFKRLWNGKNKIGKYLGLGLDVAESFAPKWVSRIRDIIQSQTNTDVMTSQAETKLQKVVRFLKQKSTRRGVATIAALLGALFGLDIQPEVLMQSLTGIVTGATAIVAGFYSIKDIFTDEEN